MVKIICFMRRKPGLSFEEFKTYYEEKHVPLINRMLPFHVDYRRNFVDGRPHETDHLNGQPAPDFDVVTELTYPDETMYQKVLDALADEEIGGIIREDEAQFFDRDSMRAYIVDERRWAA